MSLVSIIVPFYNAEKYIERCACSLFAQTYNPIEFVFVNDSSSDSSVSILRDVINKHSDVVSRVRIIENDVNRGQAFSREKGIKESSGDFVFFCDSDDALPEDSIEKLMEAKGQCDIVIGNMERITTEGKRNKSDYSLKYGNDSKGLLKSLLRGDVSHSMCGKLFSSRLFNDTVRGSSFRISNGEDAYMLYDLSSKISAVRVINNVVYSYYTNPASISHVKLTKDALEGIILTWKQIETIVKPYIDLDADWHRRIMNSQVYYRHLGYRDEMIPLEAKYGFQGFLSLRNINKYFSFKERFRMLKRLVFIRDDSSE